MKKATAIYIIKSEEKKVLLALKQKFVGVNKRFPYGGKLEDLETPEECSVREVEEESGGLTIKEEDLIPLALITFWRGKTMNEEPVFKGLFYICEKFEGNPSSTDEMKDPKWYDFENLPLDELKEGDEIILPKLLRKEMFIGKFLSSAKGEKLLYYEIAPAEKKDLVL